MSPQFFSLVAESDSTLLFEDWDGSESVNIGTGDSTPPNNVTNLVTSIVTETSLTLGWTASDSSDIDHYAVYNGATLLNGAVTGTTFNVTGLTQGTEYTFRVKSIDASGNASTGATVTVTTTASVPDTTAPDNVANLTATPAETTVDLSWTASASLDVAGYDIYNGATLVTTVTGITYQVTGLTASTAYAFTVKAKDTSNNVASGTSVNTTTTAPLSWVTDGLVQKWDDIVSQSSFANDGTYYPQSGQFSVVATLKPKAYLNIMSQSLIGSPTTSTVRYFIEDTAQTIQANTWGTVDSVVDFPGVTSDALLTSLTTDYHVVFIRDTDGFKVYINNVLNKSVALVSNYLLNANITPPAEVVKIGDAACDIKHLLYYNKALSTAELTQNYNALQ